MGGGVLIAIKNEIDGDEFTIAETIDLEAICVRVALSNSNLYLHCLYIQPTASIDIYVDHLRAIDKIEDSMSLGDISVYCGDWNLPNTSWINDDDGFGLVPIIGESQCAKAIITRHVTDHLLNRGLSQLCNLSNKYGNVLDLVYTNMPELTLFERADMLIIPDDISDDAHTQVSLTIECEPILDSIGSTPSIYCYKKANYEAMCEYLKSFNFGDLFNLNDANEMVDSLYDILYDAIERFVPKTTVRTNNKPIWFDNKLTNLKNIMNRQYNKLCNKRKSTNCEANDADFKKAQMEFYEYQKIRYHEHIKDISSCSKSDPKRFWKYINGKRTCNSIPNKLSYDGETATDDMDRAKMFAKFFASVYINHDNDMGLSQLIQQRNDRGCFNAVFSYGSVLNVLQSMDLNKGASPDKISPHILRNCAEVLAEPLRIIFQESMNAGIFPERWKTSQITPIFKAGAKSDVNNYRGVSVIPTLSKVYEKSLYNQLKMVIHPLLSNNQHGFMPNRNIETNLMAFSIKANEAFERGAQLDVFYADIKKAFDTVNQSLLLRKLAKFPLSNQVLLWIQSYFAGRKQFVKVGNATSNTFGVPSSVGQGTVLGPLFFSAFFNDSDSSDDPTVSFNFADDKKKAHIIVKPEDTLTLQAGIDKFVSWCKENGLEIHFLKCKMMTFTHKRNPIVRDYFINGKKIERVTQIRDLGVIMDPKLKFISHHEYIKRKSTSMLHLVKRLCKNKFDLENAKLLYFALVRSNLEFASPIWAPRSSSHINFIESVQRQAVIYLHEDYKTRSENNFVLPSYSVRCAEIEVDSLLRRRVNAAVLFIHKIISGRYSSQCVRNQMKLNTGVRTLRNPEFIRIPSCKTDYALNSPFNWACRAFNLAAIFIDPTISIYQFKSKLLSMPDTCFGPLANLN